MGERGRRAVAWCVCAAALVLLTAAAGLALAGWSTPPPAGFSDRPSQVVGAVALLGAPILGAVLSSRPRSLRYGWWWCLLGLGFGMSLFAESSMAYAIGQGRSGDSLGAAATAGDLGWIVAVMAVPFLLLRFPDGAAPSRRWRALEAVLYGAASTAVAGVLLSPGEASIAPVPRAVLTSSMTSVGMALVVVGVVVLLGANVPALASLLIRYRRASAGQRAQIKWVVYAAVLLGLSLAVLTWWDAPGMWDVLLEAVPLVALYVAVGVAALRHHVFDIDLVINRTLVYGVLSAGVAAVYVGVVGFLSALFDTRASLPVTLAATAVVALSFEPLRARVQRGVNRLLYGDRDEPLAAVSRLARALEAAIPTEAVLPSVVETTARALRLPHASIWQRAPGGLRLAAAYGAAPAVSSVAEEPGLARALDAAEPIDVDAMADDRALADALAPTGATLAYPLQHQGTAVGLLCLAPRAPGDAWTRQDRSTLADLARQAGAAVHATTLASELEASLAELQRSRESLVASQEQERRRIQRDLHDGLGPTLAAVRLHLEACLEHSAGAAPHLRGAIERVDELVGQAASDVRRLIMGLHPPALAQLGFVPALRAHVEQFGRDVGIRARFIAEHEMSAPAAVEVAVLRVAQEALTNVAKHAQASLVDVSLSHADGWLRLEIRDDGAGLPAHINGDGSGIAGMRERAVLLGGRLAIGAGDTGGTHVTLTVPLEPAR